MIWVEIAIHVIMPKRCLMMNGFLKRQQRVNSECHDFMSGFLSRMIISQLPKTRLIGLGYRLAALEPRRYGENLRHLEQA